MVKEFQDAYDQAINPLLTARIVHSISSTSLSTQPEKQGEVSVWETLYEELKDSDIRMINRYSSVLSFHMLIAKSNAIIRTVQEKVEGTKTMQPSLVFLRKIFLDHCSLRIIHNEFILAYYEKLDFFSRNY